MKTIDEMCKVMQAYKDGKKIEYSSNGKCWIEITEPIWDWDRCDYRVKPEPHFVHYDSVLEVERNKWLRIKRDASIIRRIESIDLDENKVLYAGCYWTMEELFEKFEYEDGSPCGKAVEE